MYMKREQYSIITLTTRIYVGFAMNTLAVKISISVIDVSLMQKLSTILDMRLRRFLIRSGRVIYIAVKRLV